MEIDTDYADLKTIDEQKGYSIGFNSKTILVNGLKVELFEQLIKYLENGKGILVDFYINENQSMSKINNFIESLNDYINNDAEVIFSTHNDCEIELDKCKFKIYITGLDEF